MSFKPFKSSDSESQVGFEEHLNKMIAKRDIELMKLQEELKNKDIIINNLKSSQAEISAFMSREDLKKSIVKKIVDVYPTVTTEYALDILEEIKGELIAASTKSLLKNI